MKIAQPKPFTFEAGPRAVLLLHGFTGHSADVRMLGRYLQKKGYTSHAPIYRGHGVSPEELLETNPEEWWEDVNFAMQHLQDLGYDEIAVAGLSLGGVLGLKLAYSTNIKGVVPMCAPMYFDNDFQLSKGFKYFSKEYKKMEGKEENIIEKEVDQLMKDSEALFEDLGEMITDVKNNVDTIYTPTFVVQARNDEMINTESATYIYNHVESDVKDIKWYEESGHVITLGDEKDQLHEDVHQFLEQLDWKE
ncbi:alpha/beta hydrolase [Oceanobacillus halophilus]|uniref:Alpha/beta fold hydrolase n=1 Tax=Oceanobacillus halophilus TaxID=930130 RepID=A0A495A703_9BACI|nr:alpha/beta fold hydrolase [Oceanobacillus halophilus]RKQ35529.1 alpha/beta fold hydrolase [Oceanobacillus halophilus]